MGNYHRVEEMLKGNPRLASEKSFLKYTYGQLPLQWAVEIGNKTLANLLLDNGCNVNIKETNKGSTPLHWVAENDNGELAELFLARKADLSAKNYAGHTPLQYAVMARLPAMAVATVLLGCGADVNSTTDGTAILHHAAGQNKQAAVKLLLAHGADVNSQGFFGKTSLHHATDRSAWKSRNYCCRQGLTSMPRTTMVRPLYTWRRITATRTWSNCF